MAVFGVIIFSPNDWRDYGKTKLFLAELLGDSLLVLPLSLNENCGFSKVCLGCASLFKRSES